MQSQHYEKEYHESCIEHEQQRMNTHAVNLYGAAVTSTAIVEKKKKEEKNERGKKKEIMNLLWRTEVVQPSIIRIVCMHARAA